MLSPNNQPICTDETIAVMKFEISNLKWHYETKHRNSEETFPQNSVVRTTKINALKSSYQVTSRILVTSMTQQKATECSLRVVWILGKHKKPFSDAEIIKECMTEVMDTMFEGKGHFVLSITVLMHVA